jgi:hypothetical protein
LRAKTPQARRISAPDIAVNRSQFARCFAQIRLYAAIPVRAHFGLQRRRQRVKQQPDGDNP